MAAKIFEGVPLGGTYTLDEIDFNYSRLGIKDWDSVDFNFIEPEDDVNPIDSMN